jgi:hypothetical protein
VCFERFELREERGRGFKFCCAGLLCWVVVQEGKSNRGRAVGKELLGRSPARKHPRESSEHVN